MFPLLAIGGVIGAAMSIAKGVSWVSDQLGSTNSASAGGKSDTTSQAGAKASSFEATLAAQAAGQGVPVDASSASMATPVTAPAVTAPATVPQASLPVAAPELHGTDYGALARMRAGIFAYSHIGEHQGDQGQTGQPPYHANSAITGSLAGT